MTPDFILQRDDPRIDVSIPAERVIDASGAAQKFGQFLEKILARMSFLCLVVGNGPLDTRPKARPRFGRRVTGLNEETVGRSVAGRENGDSVGVIEARQVPEIAVLSKGELGIGRAHGKAPADEDRDGVWAHRFEQQLTPFGKHGGSLSHPRIERVLPQALR